MLDDYKKEKEDLTKEIEEILKERNWLQEENIEYIKQNNSVNKLISELEEKARIK